MSTWQEIISTPEYKNYIKAGLCLDIAKDGLMSFVEEISYALHEDITSKVSGQHCTTCTHTGILYRNQQKDWIVNCPNKICDKYLKEILSHHTNPRSRDIGWNNCDVQTWPRDHWEVTKSFIPASNARHKGPGELDIGGMMNLFLHCKDFMAALHKGDICETVRSYRNSVMHSADMKIETTVLQKGTSALIKLLKDQKTLAGRKDATQAVENIKEVVSANFNVTANDELRVMIGKLAEFETRLQNLGETTSNVVQMISYLQQQEAQSELKSEIYEKMASLSQTVTEKESSGAEVLKKYLLDVYQEHYSTIPVSPVFEHRKVPLEAIYTEVVIVNDFRNKYGTQHKQLRYDHSEVIETRVRSVSDILYDGTKQLKSVYLLGEAGKGKTVWSIKLVQTWMQSQLKKSELTSEETTLAAFTFLFYVPLRFAKANTSLVGAVCDFISEKSEKRNKIEYVFDTMPEKVLVILDGLDECATIPTRHRHHEFTIITTSRPWKFDVIYDKDLRIDRVLKLNGLNKTGVENMIRKVSEVRYGSKEENVSRMMETIEEVGLLDLAKTPLILLYLIHTWFRREIGLCGKLPSTKDKTLLQSFTYILASIIDCILHRSEEKKKVNESGEKKEVYAQTPDTKQVDLPANRKYHVLRHLRFFVKNKNLISKLSNLAFNTLIAPEKEEALIFSEDTITEYFPQGVEDSMLLACLEIGLLSKTEWGDDVTKQYVMSFPHKLFQEFFSAFRVVESVDERSRLEDYFSSLDAVHDMSNVLIFVNGFCSKTGSELSKHIMLLCDKNEKIRRFRCDLGAETYSLRQLTDMFIRCASENKVAEPDKQTNLCLLDVYIDSSKYQNNNYYRGGIVNLLVCNSPRLLSLKVEELGEEESAFLGPCLSDLHALEHLYLAGLSKDKTFLRKLSDLLNLGKLRTVKLWCAILTNFHLDMSKSVNLFSVEIGYFYMSNDAWGQFVRGLNSLRCLKILKLLHLTTDDEETPICGQQELRFMPRLQELSLLGSLTPVSILHPMYTGLNEAVCLQKLELEWAGVTKEAISSLVTAITKMQYLKDLWIEDLEFYDTQLDFSRNKQLEKLEIRGVIMPDESWCHLSASFQGLQELTFLKFHNVNIDDRALEIPKFLTIEDRQMTERGNLKGLVATRS